MQAQSKVKSTPLHVFFQQNFDSTIIYHVGSNWNNSPHYLIIAKHKERVYFFTYISPYRHLRGAYYPGNLPLKIMRAESTFQATAPDTNRYFLPRPLSSDTLLRAWQLLNLPHLWLIKDERETPTSRRGCTVIMDGDENTLYLIDKQTIKAVDFYTPDDEGCEEQDPNRQQVVKVRDTLLMLLKQWNRQWQW
ncbi:hypothetical protein [Hymenobacter cavernae]|nr:hypothetical protein [Hymenobacter cavernae]